jgi:hypothetical protein
VGERMIMISFWYDIPEITEKGHIVQKKKGVQPTMKSIILTNLTKESTFEHVQQLLWKKLKIPPSHQALEQIGGRRKTKPTNDVMKERHYESYPKPHEKLIDDLGINIYPKKKNKEHFKKTFHLRTRISVYDYSNVNGKFYNRFNFDGSYHHQTIMEAISSSYTSTLIMYMWKKHVITRFVLICFILVACLSLFQSFLNVSLLFGYDIPVLIKQLL